MINDRTQTKIRIKLITDDVFHFGTVMGRERFLLSGRLGGLSDGAEVWNTGEKISPWKGMI